MNLVHRAFDVFFMPFERFEPFWGMLAISAVTGVLMLIVYKFTSNQPAIARAKERIKGHLLETWIYREQVGVMLRAQKNVLWANLVYMGHNMKPLAVMIIPVLLIMITLNFRYGIAPLKVGDTTLVKVTRDVAVPVDEMTEQLSVPDGLEVASPPVRIESKGETYWRVKAVKPGNYEIKISAAGSEYEKSLSVDGQGRRIASLRSASMLDRIFYPGEPPIAEGSPIKSIEVGYASQSPRVPGTGWRPNWLLQFFVLSILFGFALKGPLKVEI